MVGHDSVIPSAAEESIKKAREAIQLRPCPQDMVLLANKTRNSADFWGWRGLVKD
jgi:hypothetical protein